MNKVRTTLKKIGTFIKRNYLKAGFAISTFLASLTPNFAHATGEITVSSTDLSLDDTMSKIITFVLTMLRYLGVVLLIWGVAQFFLAWKNDDADSKQKSLMFMIAAIALISIKSVIISLGLIS